MPRKQKVHHFIYKTTCLITDKYYVGMHSTNDLNDGYLGSGKRLHYSINKYGEKKHYREILEFLPNKKELKKQERKIVNEKLLKDFLCMNLTLGGNGNWEYLNSNSEIQRKKGIKGQQKIKWLYENDPDWAKKVSLSRSKGQTESYKNGRIPITPDWTGKKHKKETKRKIGEKNSLSQSGIRNSQFGTCWIYNLKLKKNHKIKNEKLNFWNDKGWLKGRRMSF